MISLWFLLVPLIGFFVYRFRRRRMYALASLIPPPPEEVPLIGIAHTLTGDTEDIMATMQHFSYSAMKQNGFIRGWLGHILYFCATDPLDIEAVLKNCLEKDDLHRFMRKVLGYGGIFAPVSIWRRRRKILLPAFSPKIVETFVEVFSEQSLKMAAKLKASAGQGATSIWPYLSTYTLDSVCETAMGVKINAQDDPKSPFLISMNRILNLVCERIFHLWLQADWMFKWFPQFPEHEHCIKVMHGFTDQVIKHKRDQLKLEEEKKNNISQSNNENDLSAYRKSFLDHLITFSGGEKGYSNLELREEVLTLTIAGTDTSAVAIGYTLMLLGKYPEVQERVYQEIYDIFGDSDRPLVKEDLLRLKYLERVVKESLRLFPPVPLIIRKVLEDITLPSGRVLPAGAGVVVSIWGVHRDPQYWGPDVEYFDPDRFLPERFNLQHPCSYMPFSNGPRNCVGYQYALMSVKTALSSIIRYYKVVGDKETGRVPRIRVKLDIMMKAVDDYKVALEERQKQRPAPAS